MKPSLIAIALVVGVLQVHAAAPAHRGGMILRQFIKDCRPDRKLSPPTIVLRCPAGCTVEISNGATSAFPPNIVISRDCQALR